MIIIVGGDSYWRLITAHHCGFFLLVCRRVVPISSHHRSYIGRYDKHRCISATKDNDCRYIDTSFVWVLAMELSSKFHSAVRIRMDEMPCVVCSCVVNG